MSEDKLGLHVDTDWKKQEQEEKRKTAATAPAGVVPGAASAAAAPTAGSAPSGRQAGGRGTGQREVPAATLGTLVHSILTQVLFYLGELSTRGAEPMINLDMAKHNIDTLSV